MTIPHELASPASFIKPHNSFKYKIIAQASYIRRAQLLVHCI
jgi:hypothetical protein